MSDKKQSEDAAVEDAHVTAGDVYPFVKQARDVAQPVPGHVRGMPPPAAPATLRPLVTVTRQSVVAAGDQFNAMAHPGFDRASVFAIGDRVQDSAGRSKAGLDRFIQDGAFAVDQHGGVSDYLDYLRAVEAIQAKAVTLGYGAQAKAIPIDTVPGGYVGRYERNDIYAAAQ
ncbi:MAG TPA: hypothetical protein VHT91_45395 [Kofleriaceae bacterium]|jgi:hypothetical protein|nr:hypothetical protein [Kofleriaceae bacterium]